METNSNADSDFPSQTNPMPESNPVTELTTEPQISAETEPTNAVVREGEAEVADSDSTNSSPAPAEVESGATHGSSAQEELPFAVGSESPSAPQEPLDRDKNEALGEAQANRESGEVAGQTETTSEAANDPEDPLLSLATRAQAQRLSPADEERACTLLKEALVDGRAGVSRGIEALSKLPWVVGVNAVTAVWQEMKPASRTQLFGGLARMESDNAKRMRLSLARGLYKQDVPVALKIATNVSKEMRDKETGALQPKHAQIFANVLIGRAKPWIGQVQLNELRPGDAEALVHCALLASFSLPHAPITQLGVLKWASEAGRLAKIHPTVLDAAVKTVGRWSAKWQSALRKEVTDLPEPLLAALKAPSPKEPTEEATAEPEGQANLEIQAPKGKVAPPDPDADGDGEEAAVSAKVESEEPDPEDAEAPHAVESGESGSPQSPGAGQQRSKQRPVYESKTIPRKPQQQAPQAQGVQQPPAPTLQKGSGGSLREAAIPDLLRAVEAQFQSLRSELQRSEAKLRQKDEDFRRAQKKTPDRASVPVIEGEPTPEELARLNRQLENRNVELQARIEDLTADAEARAVSVGAVTDEPVGDPNTQLRTLLVLKLQEDFEDFRALEKESPDVVVQQHYRTVLRHVFEVLTAEGVRFAEPAPLP